MKYEILTSIPNHMAIQDKVTSKAWPEFMLHDPVCNKYWSKLFEIFPQYQFTLTHDSELLGIANCIPFVWHNSFKKLPEKGWDWVLEKGFIDKQNGLKPNILNGLQIVVAKKFQGKKISSVILQAMINLAKKHGFKFITIPVRPSLKSRYPLTSIDNYIQWKRQDGLPFDPWLRVHIRMGAEIIKPCHEAMYISGTISEWEQWTNMKFFESGLHIIEGALNPVAINIEKNLGEYIEPNVWVVHKVD